MAAANPKPASKRLIEAAAVERQALEHDLRALDERRLALQSELRSVEIAEREMRRRLQLVSEIAGSHKPRALRVVDAREAESRALLRGRAIREAAVQVVAASSEPTRPRHYGDWYAELLNAGYAVAGRDPQAAFLTQLNRSPVVRRDPEPGVYRPP